MQEVWNEGAKKLNIVFSGKEYKNSPKWDQNEQRRLSEWMIREGFPVEALSTLGSWQVFKWARDSMLRGEEDKAVKKTMKRVVKLPKIKAAKPSTPLSKESGLKSRINDAKQRQRKAAVSGRKNFNESMDLIKEMMKT